MSNIYADLYDIVEQRLQEYDIPMPSTKDAFCYSVNIEPGILAGNGLEEMGNMAFFESVYLGMLNRLPDETANAEWKGHMKWNKDRFQQELLNDVVSSTEAILKGGCFKNNRIIETRQRELFRVSLSMTSSLNGDSPESSRQKLIDALYKVYMKLPGRLRLFLRKIIRRG